MEGLKVAGLCVGMAATLGAVGGAFLGALKIIGRLTDALLLGLGL